VPSKSNVSSRAGAATALLYIMTADNYKLQSVSKLFLLKCGLFTLS